MGADSKIEWTDDTWNPVLGCTKVSPGCTHCYAVGVVHKLASNPNEKIAAANAGLTAYHANGKLDWTGVVRLIPARLAIPLRKQRPTRYFVNSLSDLFHEGLTDAEIARVFAVMAAAKHHTFQVLTKRPERMASLLGGLGRAMFEDLVDVAYEAIADERGWVCDVEVDAWPLPNVWLGTSVENQRAADERIPHLIRTPAAVRFLSCEPLLGPVSLEPWLDNISNLPHMLGDWCPPPRHGDPETGWYHINDFEQPLHWVIVGGESGAGARPMYPDWARQLRDQCQAADISYFFKQWGAHVPVYLRSTTAAPSWHMDLVGKKAAGRALDGRTWDEMPGARS